jgi:acyl-CoA synthetase (AMP-forming)/AMP-acid ligase II
MSGISEFEAWTEVSPLADLLVRAATLEPTRDAIVFPDGRFTYREVLGRALGIARGLLALGIKPGDHVGLLAPNAIEFVEGFFGTALAGGIVVPLNARHKTSELAYIAENADLVALLTTGDGAGAYVDFTELMATALPGIDTARDATHLQLHDAPKLRCVVMLKGEERPGFVGRAKFDELASRVDVGRVHEARSRVRVRDVALLLYTSGTTADPKGCMLTHEAVTRGGVYRARTRFGTGTHDVTWGAGPLFHIGSLGPFLGSIGAVGTYLTDVHFEPGRAIKLMERERVTAAFPWFPAVIQPLLDHPTFNPGRLDKLRSILVIGPRPLIERVQEALPDAEMVAACGMTETAGIYALSGRSETVEQRSEAQGKAATGVEIRIVDIATGEELPDNEVGELLVRGYCVMERYYRDPEKTANALSEDGWLHTGDYYSRTPDGRVTFHGRLKDMLKVGGENVAAVEIESFLCRHPAVQMASVIGMPDPLLDEVPVAFVELVEGQELRPEQLIEFCRGQISRYKIPREVHFIGPDEWPMSLTKINKRGLRARLQRQERADG